MVKLKSVNSKAFDKEVATYQKNIRVSVRGQAIYRALQEIRDGIEPTNREVAYIHAVLAATENEKVEPGTDYVGMAVEYLFCLMTPYSVSCLRESGNNSKQIKYMAKLTDEVIVPFKEEGIVWVRWQDVEAHRARLFMVMHKFYGLFCKQVQLILHERQSNCIEDPLVLKTGKKIAGKGENFHKAPEVTLKAWEKVRTSKFVFKSSLYYSDEGTHIISDAKAPTLEQMAVIYAMEGLNYISDEPQHPVKWHLQDSGRLHTQGGVLAMPQWFRHAFIKSTEPSNVMVDVDLKCAQLVLLCKILDATETLNKVQSIIRDPSKSVWNYLGDSNIPKKAKKLIVYAFCFGAQLKNIPYMATCEASRRGYRIKIDKSMVAGCLTEGILSELVELRNNWLDKFNAAAIIKNKAIVVNDLGLKLDLIDYSKTLPAKSTKAAGKYLAHLAQGAEQHAIQSLIADVVDENILAWQYDGISIECPYSHLESLKHRYDSYLFNHFPDLRLDYEVVGLNAASLVHQHP